MVEQNQTNLPKTQKGDRERTENLRGGDKINALRSILQRWKPGKTRNWVTSVENKDRNPNPNLDQCGQRVEGEQRGKRKRESIKSQKLTPLTTFGKSNRPY